MKLLVMVSLFNINDPHVFLFEFLQLKRDFSKLLTLIQRHQLYPGRLEPQLPCRELAVHFLIHCQLSAIKL